MFVEREKIIFDDEDLKQVCPTPNLNLPDLKTTCCYCPTSGEPYLIFDCEPAERHNKGCTACGSIDFVGHGYANRPRLIHDVNVGITRVDLRVRVPRYRCRDCGSVFTHVFDCAPEGRQMTYRLYEQLQRDVFRMPFKQLSKEFGYSEATIRNIFDEVADKIESQRGPIIAPEVLGIDEKHISNEMRGVFVDIKRGTLLEMTEANKRDDIIGTIEKMVDYDKNIKIVTTDMANNYKSYVEECLPNAKLIVDKYHVYQDLYRKIVSTKTDIMKRIAKRIKDETDPNMALHLRDIRDLVTRNAYLFKFGKEKIKAKPHLLKIMAEVCDTFPEFNHLRLIKEGFERIYDAETRSEAERLYNEWIPLIPPAGKNQLVKWETQYGVDPALFLEFRKFHNTTKRWYKEIFNYFDPGCQFTNAASEGLNSFIQRVNAPGSGYGFRHLRAKALFWHLNNTHYTYSLETRTESTSFGGRSSYTAMKMFIPDITTTKSEIVRHTHRPSFEILSVLYYIPQNSEYYAFPDIDDPYENSLLE